MKAGTVQPRGLCRVCGVECAVTLAGRIRVHKVAGVECNGSGRPPAELPPAREAG